MVSGMSDTDSDLSGHHSDSQSSLKAPHGHNLRPEEMWRRYEFIANTSRDFMTLISADYRYEAANLAYCRAHNKSQAEIIGRRVADIWGTDKFNSTIKPQLDACFAGNEVTSQSWFQFATLGLRYMDVTYYPYYNEQGVVTHAVVVSRDMTAYKLAEDQTYRQLKRLTALHNVDAAIAASLDLEVILKVLLEQVTTQLGVDAADVLLLDPETETLEYAAGCGFGQSDVQRSRLRLGEGHAGQVARQWRILGRPNLPAAGDNFSYDPWLQNEHFVAYYGVPLVAGGQLKGVLELFHRTPLASDSEWLSFLETLAGQAAVAIDNAQLFESVQQANIELILAYDATLEGWVRALDLRDEETSGHTQRVTDLTVRLARALGVDEAEVVDIRRGALLHDIGKMGIPDHILRKPGPLDAEEQAIMRRHPLYAYELLSPITFLRNALQIPYCHHERWDGSGYPRGLKGEQIPLAARIFAVVDVWDALRSDRPYRAAWPADKARQYIREQAGTHFDPAVVQAFLDLNLEDTA